MSKQKPHPDNGFHLPSSRAGKQAATGGLTAGLITVVLLAAVVGAVGGYIWWARSKARIHEQLKKDLPGLIAVAVAQKLAQEAANAAASAAGAGKATAVEREQVVDDADGSLLWASPTDGPPISMAYVPAGTQCLIYLRPAQLAAHPEGEKVLAALGPWGAEARAQFEDLAGVKLDEIDAALISLVVARDGSIDASLRAEPVASWDEAELARRLPSGRAERQDERSYVVDGKRAWFLAPGAGVGSRGVLVACPASLVKELIASEGVAPLLARDIEALVATSDADRSATAIVGAKFLAASGTHLMEGEAEPLRDAIATLLGDDATAASLSVHWGDAFFAELRAAPALTVPSRWLATTLQARIAEGAADVDVAIDAGTWSEYGRAVLTRVPAMVEKLAQMSRRGEVDKQAVVRAYLPTVAGHNLLMGAELLLTQSESKSKGHAHEDESMAHKKDGRRTVEERLAKVTSLAFPKETLQRALELLAEDVGVAIEIDGAALRAEGITQNQSFALAERERSAEAILVAILRLANPDRTAAGPADPRQKLVYVVDRTATGGGRMIVTTRAAAAERGQTLPRTFGGDGE
jgi:hypothetical protein